MKDSNLIYPTVCCHINRPIPTAAVSGIAIYGRDDTPKQLAYDVTKALDEQQGILQWSQQNFLTTNLLFGNPKVCPSTQGLSSITEKWVI